MTQALEAINPFKPRKIVNTTNVTTPITPTATQASARRDTAPVGGGGSSFISSGSSTGLARKASTQKRTLIGGSS